MKIIAVIPARLASTRFPEKVLAAETGKFLIQHTWERASLATLPQKVIIAADDDKIIFAAKSFGATAVLTSTDCQSGSDRIAQAVADLDADIIINLQADEPEIDPANIDRLARLLLDNPEYPMATLAAEFTRKEDVANPDIVKLVTDSRGRAIYFSRSPIPYNRGKAGIGEPAGYLRHIGIYAYRKDFLLKFTQLPQSNLEGIEKLEQLRAIENGYAIITARVSHTCDGIDTPRQYADFVKRYNAKKNQT